MYFSRTFKASNFDFQIQGLSRTFKVRANPANFTYKTFSTAAIDDKVPLFSFPVVTQVRVFTSDRIMHSPVTGFLEVLLWFCLLASGLLRVAGWKLPCYSHKLAPVKDLQRKNNTLHDFHSPDDKQLPLSQFQI